MTVQLQSENACGHRPFPFEGEEDADVINAVQADHHRAADHQLFLQRGFLRQ